MSNENKNTNEEKLTEITLDIPEDLLPILQTKADKVGMSVEDYIAYSLTEDYKIRKIKDDIQNLREKLVSPNNKLSQETTEKIQDVLDKCEGVMDCALGEKTKEEVMKMFNSESYDK